MARIARLAQLRRHLADDIRIRAGSAEISPRDAILGAVSAWRPPPGGIDVRFVDTQVFIDSATTARAYMSVEVATLDPRGGQPTVDRQDTSVRLEKRDGQWVITTCRVEERHQGAGVTPRTTPVIISPEIVTRRISRAV